MNHGRGKDWSRFGSEYMHAHAHTTELQQQFIPAIPSTSTHTIANSDGGMFIIDSSHAQTSYNICAEYQPIVYPFATVNTVNTISAVNHVPIGVVPIREQPMNTTMHAHTAYVDHQNKMQQNYEQEGNNIVSTILQNYDTICDNFHKHVEPPTHANVSTSTSALPDFPKYQPDPEFVDVDKSKLTKKGTPRKRKKLETTPAQRKAQKVADVKEKHYVKAGCDECKKACNKKFTKTRRTIINGLYWEMSWKEKRYFVYKSTTRMGVKRRRSGDGKVRNNTFKYYLTSKDGRQHEVCKTFFLTTLGYDKKNDRIITNSLKNKDIADNKDIIDGRGRHKKSKVDREELKKHVESFHPFISRCGRKHAHYNLPNDVNVSFLYKDFLQKHPHVQKCSYDLYRKFLKKDLNVSFLSLGTDSCGEYECPEPPSPPRLKRESSPEISEPPGIPPAPIKRKVKLIQKYEVITGLTKKGEIRKRKRYVKPLKERKQELDKLKDEEHDVKPGCGKCRRSCHKKFPYARRKVLNTQYWLMDFQERRIFISTSITKETVQRRRSGDGTFRSCTYRYFLTTDLGEKAEICKTFFLTTLGYDQKNDRIVTNVLRSMDSTKNFLTDGRGLHKRNRMLDREIMKKHVESFHPCVAHFKRELGLNKRYLPSDITLPFMHKDFLEKHPHITNCSYDIYQDFVTKELNITFTSPEPEDCALCNYYKLHNATHTLSSMGTDCHPCSQWLIHVEKAEQAQRKYNDDVKYNADDESICCVSADFQKVVMLPRIEMFNWVVFGPRIVAFNQSFVPLNDKHLKPLACLWHECISGRSKDDLVSAFNAFFCHVAEVDQIIVWMDSCNTLYKNWTLFSYLIYIINSGLIAAEAILFRYYEAGHMLTTVNGFHYQCELAMQKKRDIYNFDDFSSSVRTSLAEDIDIKKMREDDFYIWPDHSSLQRIINTKPKPLLAEMVEVYAVRGKYSLCYKTRFTQKKYKEVKFLKMKALKNGLETQEVFANPRGIDEERKTMILQSLSDIVPPNRMQFWKNLTLNKRVANLVENYEDCGKRPKSGSSTRSKKRRQAIEFVNYDSDDDDEVYSEDDYKPLKPLTVKIVSSRNADIIV